MQAKDQSAPDPDGFVWSAGCVDGKLILGRRRVSAEERGSTFQAVAYIESFVNSPFARLDFAVAQYFRDKERLIDAVADRSFQRKSDETPLSEKFSQILQRYRAYNDRTRFQLKRRYGPKSKELTAFDRALQDAANQSFAYRFIGYLRDQDQHARPVIDVTASERLGPTGQREPLVATTVRNDVLDDALVPRNQRDKRERQQAAEIRRLARPVDVDPLLAQLMEAVASVEASRLVAEADHIQRAIAQLRALTKELNCEGGKPSLVGYELVPVDGKNIPKRIRIVPLMLPTVESLERALENARQIVGVSVADPQHSDMP